jgi:hypothetical protein
LFEAKDILQTNVAMIVGILIFYTIQFLIPANGDVRQRLHAKIVVFCISIAIGFFFAIYKTDDNSSSRSLGFIVLFVMDRDNKRPNKISDMEDLDLICSLILLERKIGHHVATADLYTNFSPLEITDPLHVITFLIDEKPPNN